MLPFTSFKSQVKIEIEWRLVQETSREWHESAPYLRLKKLLGSKYFEVSSIFYITQKTPNVGPNWRAGAASARSWRAKRGPFGISQHFCHKTSKNEVGGGFFGVIKNSCKKSLIMSKKTERGSLGSFNIYSVSRHQKIEGDNKKV